MGATELVVGLIVAVGRGKVLHPVMVIITSGIMVAEWCDGESTELRGRKRGRTWTRRG